MFESLELLMMGDLEVHAGMRIALVLGVEVLVKDREGQFGGIDADLPKTIKDTGTAGVFLIGDGLKVLPPVVGGDAVLVVDTGLVDGSYPSEIDRMGYEDVLFRVPSVIELPIALYAFGIRFVFTVLCGSGCGIDYYLHTIRRNTQTDFAIGGHIELVAVVGLMGHEAQECAIVHFSGINRLNHNIGSLVQRRCYSSNPMQR